MNYSGQLVLKNIGNKWNVTATHICSYSEVISLYNTVTLGEDKVTWCR